MTAEDALYFELLLSNGYKDEFEVWLSEQLEKETSLSDPVQELAFCQSSLRDTVSVLYNFRIGKHLDIRILEDKLKSFLSRMYREKKMSSQEVMDFIEWNLYAPHMPLWDIPWKENEFAQDIQCLYIIYVDDLELGWISQNEFEYLLGAWLEDRISVNEAYDRVVERRQQETIHV